MKNQLFILLKFPYKWWIAFLLLLSRFLVFTVQQFDYCVSNVNLFEYPIWNLLIFLHTFLKNKFGKFLATLSLDILLAFVFPFYLSYPSRTPIMCTFIDLVVFHMSLSNSSFLFIFFVCSSLYSLYQSIFKFTNCFFSASTNILLSPASRFFQFSYCILNSRISFVFFFLIIPMLCSMRHYHYTFLFLF